MNRNMLKLPPWFKQQFGVPGGDTPNGIRSTSSSRTFYVDNDHPLASNDNDGTDPNAPKATISGAVVELLLANGGEYGDEIIVALSDTAYAESVVIDDATLYPEGCKIIGQGKGVKNGVLWGSGSATEPCLVLGGTGWEVEGFHFICPVTDSAIIIPNGVAPYANGAGNSTVVRGCYFDGNSVGLRGIDLFGAPYQVLIENNIFGYITNVGTTSLAIASTDISGSEPTDIEIIGNTFFECNLMIDAELNTSLIKDNVFHQVGAVTSSIVIDLTSGSVGLNMVVGNYFGGPDYAIAGGYLASDATAGMWLGNYTLDVAEAEVGDNGITFLPPA